MAALFTPPGTPPGVLGFLNLRGHAIAILRLDRLFDLPEQRPGLHTPLVLVRAAGNLVGVLVERVRQIGSADLESWLPRDDRNVFHDCALATFLSGTRVTHALAPDGILLEHERSLVVELQAAVQDRLRLLEAVL